MKRRVIKIKRKTAEFFGSVFVGAAFAAMFLVILASM